MRVNEILESRQGLTTRNFVAKNMKSAGSGQHKNKKRAAQQGDVKHRAKAIPVDEATSLAQQAAIAIAKKQSVEETSDYFRRRQREEDIISGKKPARKKTPAQTSDYARRREQEKKQDMAEGSWINGKLQDPKSLGWKQTSLTYSEAVAKYGKDRVRKEGKSRDGREVVAILAPLVAEGSQRFNKPEPYWVCVNGKKWKHFKTYHAARRAHDRLEKKFQDEDSDKRVSLLADLDESLRDPKDNPCWKGYKPVGTKKKAGKTVPNCVPVAEGRSLAQAADPVYVKTNVKPRGPKPRQPVDLDPEQLELYRDAAKFMQLAGRQGQDLSLDQAAELLARHRGINLPPPARQQTDYLQGELARIERELPAAKEREEQQHWQQEAKRRAKMQAALRPNR